MIYVEGLAARQTIWGFAAAAHLVSDTSLDELRAFAERLGIPRYWMQPFPVPHYELNNAWRRRAIRAGAIDCAGADRQEVYRQALRDYVTANPPPKRRAS